MEHTFYGGELTLTGVDDATAAAIIALLCDSLEIPPSELKVKSIRPLSMGKERHMKYIVTLGNQHYEVEVERGKATTITADDATTLASAVREQAPEQVETTQTLHNAVSAPMPGTIVKVLCQEGETVLAGQVLFVLEAMKMENEIQASTAGTIAKLYAREGQLVQTGAPLCVFAEA